MPFGKSRTTLQRLGDQRKRLALLGLAAGALAAAAFRRKRGGDEAEFGAPTVVAEPPTPVTPTTAVETGAPAEVEVPAAASVPDLDPAPSMTQPPPPPADSARAVETSGDADDAPAAESPTGELSAEEASILAVLAQSGRVDDDRTAIAVATSLERETTDVASVLRKLSGEGIVSGELYTAAGDKIWAVTERGVRRLGAQS